MFYCIQVLKEQSKNSKLKGDLVMEAVLEWESYFGQVHLAARKTPLYVSLEYICLHQRVFFGTLILQANHYKNQQNYDAAHREVPSFVPICV